MRRLFVLVKNILDIPKRIFSRVSVFCILQEVEIDKTAAICSGVRFYRGKIGKYSYIGNNSFVSDVSIGNFTSISTNCYIGGTSHPLYWAATSPVFHKWGNIMKKNFSRHEFDIFRKTTIGSDVWIGNGVMIKAGVDIGHGAVIGMGSVVTKNIGAYEIWAGNPARFIKKRFSDEIIEKLEEKKWWDWSDEQIELYADRITDVSSFLEETN